jgi:serine/threonine-protein kinase
MGISLNMTYNTIAHGYVFLEKIGCGGTSQVYRVSNEKFKCDFAAKVIRPSPADPNGKRHEAELDCLKRLDHPNIIRLYDHFRMNGCHVMILQYCPGGTLLKEIQASEKRALRRAGLCRSPVSCWMRSRIATRT